MGKVKSAIITALVIAATVVLTFFATVSFSVPNSVNRYNSILASVHLGSNLTGEANVILYPEGVISSDEYVSEYNGKVGEDKNEYQKKYTAVGGVYVEANLIDTDSEKQDLLDKVTADAQVLSKRFGERGYTGYSVKVIDGYAIKVSVPTNFSYAAYKENNAGARTEELTEISNTIQYLTLDGELSLRNSAVGYNFDKTTYSNLNLFKSSENVADYIKNVKSYGVGKNYAVQIKLTSDGKTAFNEATSKVASSEDTTVLFYVGETQVLSLSCSEALDTKDIYISVSDQEYSLDYSILFDSVVKGDVLSLSYDYEEIKISSAALGENTALFAAIAIAVIIFLAMVVSVVKYKKLGLVNCLIIAIYSLAIIVAVFVTETTVTVAGLICAVLGLALLCGTNFWVFEEVRKQTQTGKTIQSSVKSGYKNTLGAILDLHVVALIASALIAIIGVGEVAACGIILTFSVLMSYLLYWFTRFMWYVTLSPAKDKFAFGGYKREVFEDD